MLNWIPLKELSQISILMDQSYQVPCLIFKHSTRCSLSSLVKFRLENKWDFSQEEIVAYYLDILSSRQLSNEVAEKFSVQHESPQILLIKNGQCYFEASHLEIAVGEIRSNLKAA